MSDTPERHWLVITDGCDEWVVHDADAAEWLRDHDPNCEVQGPFVLEEEVRGGAASDAVADGLIRRVGG